MSQNRTNRKGRETLLGAQRNTGKPAARGGGARSKPSSGRFDWPGAASGFVLGMLVWQVGVQVGFQAVPLLRGHHWLLAAALLGALVGGSRFRPLLWAAAGGVCGLLLVIGYTPLIAPAIRGLVRSDALRPVEAVVVLSSDVEQSGQLTALAQSRLLRGYEVIQAGYARRLVLTRLPPPRPSYVPTVTRQMRALGLNFEIDQTETVGDTFDEALAVKRLADSRGWDTVILVTSPSHTRRAAATFERAGLRVLCTPSPAINYDLATLEDPPSRVYAFRDWLYETVGWHWYRARGRL